MRNESPRKSFTTCPPSQAHSEVPLQGNGRRRNSRNSGAPSHKDAKDLGVTAGKLYSGCLHASPPAGGWFSVADTLRRFTLVIFMFYRFLMFSPWSLIRFAFAFNSLWYGRVLGAMLTMLLPVLPVLLCVVEFAKRMREYLPWAETDWKMQGPGRVFFVRPDSLLASFLWDFYLCVSVFCGSFLQYGTSVDGIEHTWYDSICTKEYWFGLLDAVGAPRPLQLARWDGGTVHDVGPGLGHGQCSIVCKISDSYLGIGDRILTRGKAAGGDFDTLADVQALLAADPEYSGRPAVLAEFVQPTDALNLSSDGFGNVHSLDIITLRTSVGVKVLTVLLWTDCDGWSSHTCQAGYLVDVDTETIVAPTAWYSPYL
jgi:hypothetical protein